MINSPSLYEIISLALGVLALAAVLPAFRKISQLQRFQKKFFAGKEAADLERLILTHEDRLGELSGKIRSMMAEQKNLYQTQRLAVQKVGVVRFNAFADAGGNNSFAVALLDASDNGVVISSLYGRDSQRIYVKPIMQGASALPLTGEEKQAILESQKVTASKR